MDESIGDLAPNGVRSQDAEVLIGIAAILETTLMSGDMPDFLATTLHRRFAMVGLLDESGSPRDLRQAINDLNHRLRYARGEYSEPIEPIPVPD